MRQDVAIVGMSVACPGANSIREFWRNLALGVDSITDAPPDVIDPVYFEPADPSRVDRFYCRRGGFANHMTLDPLRYGILPVTVDGTDPDHILALTLSEAALGDAGVLDKRISLDRASVIIGRGNFAGLAQLRGSEIIRGSEEFVGIMRGVMPGVTDAEWEKVRIAYQKHWGRFQGDTVTSTMPNLVASHVANFFDMHGPAYTLDAACASSVVALDHACRLLETGESDLVLVGGMHTAQSAIFWSAFSMMGAMSHKGVIAPFSQEADGLLSGMGAGFIIVKTLARALADDDRIYAVVKGTAVGSDGGGHSVLVTDSPGQVRVLKRAWDISGLDPLDVGYVEAHGTGTPVGDATEIETLEEMFGGRSNPRAYLGSVKSNIGHLMPAAGMVGLIKTALALYHRQIPPTLHGENPMDVVEKSRFVLPDKLIEWSDTGRPLLAGVNAFGFGGINAHAVLTAYEEPPDQARRYRVNRRRFWSPEVYAVAGPTREAVLSKVDLNRVTFQLGGLVGRPEDPCRLVVFDPSPERVALAVKIVERGEPWFGRNDIWYTERPLLSLGGKTVFMFPGFGMVTELDVVPLADALGLDWQGEPADPGRPLHKPIADHFNTSMLVHSALTATGITADWYTGHSVGEWHAARACGMLGEDFDELVREFNMDPTHVPEPGLVPEFKIIAATGDLSDDDLAVILDSLPGVALTNDNCPSQKVFCAVLDDVPRLTEALEARHVVCQTLPFASPLHTPYMEPVAHVPLEAMAAIPVHRPAKPLWSSVTLEELPGEGTAASVLGSQLTRPVLFRKSIQKLYEMGARVFIQAGIGSLNSLVDDTLGAAEFASVSAVSPMRDPVDQVRRVHALMFVMGGACDLDFMGMDPLLQSFKSIFLMPLGAPLLQKLPEAERVLGPWVRDDPAGTGGQAGVRATGGVPAGDDSAALQPVSPVASPAPVARASSSEAPASSPALAAPASAPPAGLMPPVSASSARSPGLVAGMPPGMPPTGGPPVHPVPVTRLGLPVRGFTREQPVPIPGYGLSTGVWGPYAPVPGPVPPTAVVPPGTAAPAPASGLPDLAPVVHAPDPVPVPAPPDPAPVVPAPPDPAPVVPVPPDPAPAVLAEPAPPARERRAGTSLEEPIEFTLEDMPYVMDHCIVNQPVGWPHREDIFPVMPLALSIELLAERVANRLPDMKVVRLGPIFAMDFIPINQPFRSMLKWFWKSENTVTLTIPGHLIMDVTVAHEFPEPPEGIVERMKTEMGPSVHEVIPVEVQYKAFTFHRPRYWSLIESRLCADHGFVGLVQASEGRGSVLDNIGSAIGLFLHLYIPDNRVSFPVRVQEIAFYSDMFDQSGLFDVYSVVRRLSDSYISGDMVFVRDGRVWALGREWVNQRIGMDMAYWDSVIHPETTLLSTPVAPGVFFYEVVNPNRQSVAFLALRYFSRDDKERVGGLPGLESQGDFLAGRIAVKDAARDFLARAGGSYLYPVEVRVLYDDTGRPLIRRDDGSEFEPPVQASIAHRGHKGLAMAADHPVGVDLERIEPKGQAFWDLAFTDAEQALLRGQADPDEWAIRFWVAKEACGKMRGAGLDGSPKSVVVDRIEGESLFVGETRIDTTRVAGDYIAGWTRRKQ